MNQRRARSWCTRPAWWASWCTRGWTITRCHHSWWRCPSCWSLCTTGSPSKLKDDNAEREKENKTQLRKMIKTWHYVFSDKAWWRDTLFITSSLNGRGLMAGMKLKSKFFQRLSWKKGMFNSNLKMTYFSGMKNLIKSFFC